MTGKNSERMSEGGKEQLSLNRSNERGGGHDEDIFDFTKRRGLKSRG